MKKIFQLAFVALIAVAMNSCNGGNGGNEQKSTDNAANDQQEQVAEAQGTTFEGANFTITYPEILKESFKTETTINARNEDGVKMDASFSKSPCKPDDFKTYYTNLTGMQMWKDYKFEDAKIEGNILTFKGENPDKKVAITQFVVYLDENGGVAGKVEYPLDKASEIEPLIMPMLKSIKKK